MPGSDASEVQASSAPCRAAPLRSLELPRPALRPGEWVTVRSEREILATLDERGTLDDVPFMPEMRPFCGGRFRVKARADRTFAEHAGLRRMRNAVHLDGLRCDGAAHDSCGRACLFFWKEAWLERSEPDLAQGRRGDARPLAERHTSSSRPSPSATEPWTWKTKEGDRYFCQATEVARATSRIRISDVRQFIDLFSGDAGDEISFADKAFAVGVFVHDYLQWHVLRGSEWGLLRGSCRRTPVQPLGLRPGERVRVKSREEIADTLDARGLNRGMGFSGEMLPLCGREFTVLRRVDRLIRDESAKMVTVTNAVILQGAVYKNLNALAVPRTEYMFWRECWLERVA